MKINSGPLTLSSSYNSWILPTQNLKRLIFFQQGYQEPFSKKVICKDLDMRKW
jgi:hypothetical protein